ncbi:MAG: SDR family oxidoreductase [Deltaproteobacteria bacterium]|nr:SDR family oxidoreductase [Deltaproteobacteria bacterium]
MASFLVTGGAGFIGSNLVEELLARGEDVRVLDDFSTGRRKVLEPHLDRIKVFEGSMVDLQLVRRAVEGVDYVLHQAALPSVPKSIAFPVETNAANVTGTLNVLVAARDAKVRRLVYAASSSAYGDTPELPKRESIASKPLSPYAIQKLAGELYCRVFYETYGLETVALRYFNIFGPRQDPTSFYSAVIPKFIRSIQAGTPPTIYGDGRQSRDFTYVDNVVAANLAATAASSACAGKVVNIACGERIDLLELVRVINEVLGTNVAPVHAEPRIGDVKHSHADIHLARELIGYEPRVRFREGIKKTIAWYDDNKAYW